MSTISVYLNSNSSNKNRVAFRDEIFKGLFRHDIEFKTPLNLTELDHFLNKDIQKKTDYVFSIGGDGTANRIIQKFANTKTKILVIPAGTANDFAHELGISSTVNKIIKIFQHKSTTKVDLIKINEKYMFSNGGIGLACQVAEQVNLYRNNIFGFKKFMNGVSSKIYPLILIKNLITKPLKNYEFTINCKNFPLKKNEFRSPMVLINNQSLVGGNFEIAPFTKNNDGKFNITIFLHDNKISLSKCLLQIFQGKFPTQDKNLISFETDYLKIKTQAQNQINFFGDGEILDNAREFEIKIIPKAIEVFSYNKELIYCNNYSLKEIEAL